MSAARDLSLLPKTVTPTLCCWMMFISLIPCLSRAEELEDIDIEVLEEVEEEVKEEAGTRPYTPSQIPDSTPPSDTTAVPASSSDDSTTLVPAEDPAEARDYQQPIFDDTLMLEGYTESFSKETKETLLEMIKDDTLEPYHMAAAVRAFKIQYALEIFSREKAIVEKILLRRLNRTDSVFVQVEIMHTLCLMDRYRYFTSMVPILIKRMDHYSSTINEMAYEAVNDIIAKGHNRAREARIVFNALRKILFLSRKRLAATTDPGVRLSQKLKILRWSIKVLGSQELNRLPKEVIRLL